MAVMSDLAKEFIEFFDCEYEYFANNTYEEIMEKFEKYSKEGKEKGYFPVIVTVDETLLESLSFNISDDEEFNIEDVREYRKRYISSIFSEGGKNILRDLINTRKTEAEDDEMSFSEEILGEFEKTEEEKLNSPIGFLNYRTDKPEELFIVKVPVKNPWEIFAWFPMGNWNECPSTSEHMAVSRYWFEKFGAVPITITHDVLEYKIEKIITDKETAMATAVEMYGYCPDVDQSYETLGQLAGSLVNSSVWYFWWD